MAYNTGSPVGSSDFRDLSDNAVNFDKYSVGTDPAYPNRLGVLKLSIEGMNQAFNNAQDGRASQFAAVLASFGFTWIGDYGAGLTFTTRQQYTVRAGLAYAVDNATTLPYTLTGTWATDEAKLKLINSDQLLRQELAEPDGALLTGVSLPVTGAKNTTLYDKSKDWVSLEDFEGVVGDGVHDDTVGIQRALDSGKRRFSAEGDYVISADLNIQSNQKVFGNGTFKLAAADINGFVASGKSKVKIYGVEFYSLIPGTVAYKGGVNLLNCRKSTVKDCTFRGMTWAGVLLNNSSDCRVIGNEFEDWLGAIPDSCDICVYQNSSYNTIFDNNCQGRGWHGILVQDPYTNTTPTGNLITTNRVGEHSAYGIAVYIALSTTLPYDSRTLVVNNSVKDITGTAFSGASGAGIYIQGAGGTLVEGNVVESCCRSTTNFESLAIAGISAQIGIYPGGQSVPITVRNNRVSQGRGPAIWGSTSSRGINIDGNVIYSYGTEAVRGEAIIMSAVQGGSISGNTINHENPNFNAVRVTAIDSSYRAPKIIGNDIQVNGSAGGILLNRNNSSAALTNLRLTDNDVTGTVTGTGLHIEGVTKYRLKGNTILATGAALNVVDSPRGKIVGGNSFECTQSSTPGIVFSGDCSGTIVDETNELIGLVENNTGSGVTISRYATSTAGAGTWGINARIIQANPAVGSPKGWRQTTTTGTWVSEGNL